MRKLKLYIAVSLDGKIARPDGDVEWLDSIPNPDNNDYGYSEFHKTIDTTIMGHNTYREVMGFDIPFPYTDIKNYVITRNPDREDTEQVSFISGNVAKFVRELKSGEGKDLWLIGGGQVNTLFFNEGLIDELIIFVMPIVLGEGIDLFEGIPEETRLRLADSKQYDSGVVRFDYTVPG